MRRLEDMALEFHLKYGCAVGDIENPAVPDQWPMRVALIDEELTELQAAAEKGDLVAYVDAIADLAYVVAGAAVEAGVEMGPIMEEVHRSNMSKLGDDGKPIVRADGKILKGPNYFAPNIKSMIEAQRDFYSLWCTDCAAKTAKDCDCPPVF